MRAAERFLAQPRHFWANVRSISERLGYTERGTGAVKVHRLPNMVHAMKALGLGPDHLMMNGKATDLGAALENYFEHRATVLNTFVLTGIVNMLVESSAGGISVDYDPRQLTTVTLNGAPLRTLSRRVDGALPAPVNPIAIWEIKEYYHTTSFGSRIADGVYETQLDGIELEELEAVEKFPIEHVLMVDAYATWWEDGRSYLCRIIDMLHMGLVDEVLFGREVLERLPEIVETWVAKYRIREAAVRTRTATRSAS